MNAPMMPSQFQTLSPVVRAVILEGLSGVIDPVAEDQYARADEITEGRGFDIVIDASGSPRAPGRSWTDGRRDRRDRRGHAGPGRQRRSWSPMTAVSRRTPHSW